METEKNNVVIGFKCSPSFRNPLEEQAEKKGVSLSSYIKGIVCSHKSKENALKEITEQVNRLQEKINFYEAPFLKELYSNYKGKNVTYVDRKGKNKTINIVDITDIYTVMINSFITEK